MFTSPTMTSDLARMHRRELYAAAARGQRHRTARQGQARAVRAAARARHRRPLRAWAPAK